MAHRRHYYNRRDFFSHFVRKDQPAPRPCHHACCRGMRAHPDGYPVVKRNAYLRYAGDADLTRYYERHAGDSETDEHARARVLHEMQRRDEADERRDARAQRRRHKYLAQRTERAEHVEREWAAAEAATNGYMLNRRGQEAHIDERTLFTGPESRARKYASEELLSYWEHHPRPTAAYFRGQDTRIGYSNTGIRRRMSTEEAEWRDRYERAAQGWPAHAA